MGCCCGKLYDYGITSTLGFQSLSTNDKEGDTLIKKNSSSELEKTAAIPVQGHEEKIELVFRSKRTNVFAQGCDVSLDFTLKNIPKTKRQQHTINNSLQQNFIFSTLSKEEIDSIVNAMEVMPVHKEQIIVTQGEEGDYFYIIESGLFTILVNDVAVAKIDDGKSFGELALLNNTPRAATIRADMEGSLFALDRSTFRYTLARSSTAKHRAVYEALSSVSLLNNLFDHQIAKIADAVEIVPYNYGDYIIRKGAEGNIFYIVKSGSVKVCDIGNKGQFVDHVLGVGEYFGERALITGEPRAANVIADYKDPVTNKPQQTVVMALDRQAFNSLLGPLKEVIDNNMNVNMLRTIKLFKDLSEDERSKVVRSFVVRSYAAGQTIINEGDKGTEFFIMKTGEAKVLILGKEVGVLQAGTYFGEMALLDDEVRKATVVAAGSPSHGNAGANATNTAADGTETAAAAAPVCEVFVLDRVTFNRILGSLKDILNRDSIGRKSDLQKVKENAQTGSHKTGGGNNKGAAKIAFTDLVHIGLLGSGKFARVTLVQSKKNKGQIYALKTMSKREIVYQKQQHNVMNERLLLEKCDFPFILRIEATYQDSMKLYMLLEFVQGGELFSVIHGPDHDGIPDSHAKFYSMVIAQIINYLHGKNIAYRDLKPENILIDKDGYPKLCDFGFAKIIKGSKTFTLCGTPEYLAPEIVLGRGYTKSVDYWAFGVLIYEMLVGQSPFADIEGQDQATICRNIIDGRLVFPTDFDFNCRDLLKKLLAKEIQLRLGNLKNGVDDIISHKWFWTLAINHEGLDPNNDPNVNIHQYNKLLLTKAIQAPWIPKIKNTTDISNFDPYDAENTMSVVSNSRRNNGTGNGTGDVNNPMGNIDHGEWEKEFPADTWLL